MTAGYRAGDGMPGQNGDGVTDATPTAGPAGGFATPAAVPGVPGRPAGVPSQLGGVPGQPAGVPGQPVGPANRATWPPAANSGQWAGHAAAAPHGQGGWPAAQPAAVPGQPAAVPVQPAQPAAVPGLPGQPVSGPGYPGQAVSGSGYPAQAAAAPAYPPAAGSGGRRRLPVVALALAVVLALIAGVQAYQIFRLNDRLAATDRRLAEAQGADGRRLDGLEQRAEALEKQAGAAFNPEAVASAVLPSVFRVRAGDFTGTAFAIGKPLTGGGTTLLTNFHVVESVYDSGGRKVFLERTGQRFEATVVKVDKDKDLAQLRTSARFTGLVAAAEPVRSGQQIVVVGAPLGLQDSVTTGVVSAFRKDEDGSGPVIQFDAPINPGNSGGPVINGAKEVVGIATAKARDAEGIGLAVPIKTACDLFKLC
ncbi:Trypsin-like peptidase domain-containing protein [Micromonospora viridifaciens]|uniref:Trypsin-like peptidase domain-containing protein n=1 Tax=Micromonospora viridifaciens TaxID=1881 RepID=A0A1C4ZBE1_MICVI|nr:trypsin-like peptidase domain-containing protein [Micromonospora viridifaciens]SCF30332.1 Trypsin-like peptidase domain-containing protein [Micromonospora viridifaciens]